MSDDDYEYKITRTVAELIAYLETLPQDAAVISHEPPWTGVKVVPQDSGRVLLASLWDSDEGREYRAALKAKKRAA